MAKFEIFKLFPIKKGNERAFSIHPYNFIRRADIIFYVNKYVNVATYILRTSFSNHYNISSFYIILSYLILNDLFISGRDAFFPVPSATAFTPDGAQSMQVHTCINCHRLTNLQIQARSRT